MLTLHIDDEYILQKIAQYSTTEEEQESVALYAMRLGLEAIAAIRGEIDKEALQQVGTSVLERVEVTISDVLEEHRLTLMNTLHDEITRLSQKRIDQKRSAEGGMIFEDHVEEMLDVVVRNANDLFDRTGTKSGSKGRRKVGDFVITLGDNSHAMGEKIAIEAKKDSKYHKELILNECKIARVNRGAQVCIFVWDKKSCGGKHPILRRYGNDIVVLWDAEDEITNTYFEIAYWFARSLVISKNGESHLVEFHRNQLLEIADQISEQIEIIENIQQAGKRVIDDGKIIRDSCAGVLENLQENFADMKIHIGALSQAP